MECSKCLRLSITIIGSILITSIPILHCQESESNKLVENETIFNSTPTLQSIVNPGTHMTEDIYKLLPPIEDEIHKLNKEELKFFLKKLLNILKFEYETLLDIYENIHLEEDENSNSTLVKRVKRTFKKKSGGCYSCGGQGYIMPVPVFVKPVYYGKQQCGRGCGNQRPQYSQCGGGCGGGGYQSGGGYGGGSFSQSSSSSQSYSSGYGR